MKNKHIYSREELLELIDKMAFFSDFSLYEKKALVENDSYFVSVERNTELISEGKTGDCWYILITGKIHMTKRQADLVDLGDGEIFGEMAFFARTVRSTTVVTLGDALVLRIDRELMKKLGSTIREKIKDGCIKKLVERIEKTEKRLITRGSV